jgi:hypothetical protein
MSARRLLVCLFGLSLGCGAAETTAGPSNASLIQTCAPWDGPAVGLFLTTSPPPSTYPEPPYLSITVYKSVSEIQGKSFTVNSGTAQLGIAQDFPTIVSCAIAEEARVTFGFLGSDSTVQVSYRLEFSKNRILVGQVRPRLRAAPGLCG